MSFLRSVLARLRAMDPYRVDLLLAAVGAVATVGEAFVIDATGDRALTALFGGIAVGGALALRRRDTLLAVAVFVGVLLIQSPFDTFVVDQTTAPFITLLLLYYSAGRYESGRRLSAAVAVLVPGMWVVFTLEPEFEWGDLLWTVLLFVPPILAGRALRSRSLLQQELREKAERAEAEREVRAHEAVEVERSRIASELQAAVANSVSAMVVQAEAVPRLLAAGDTRRSAEALSVVEETGRDALAEMRRLLGVLRRDGGRPELAPQPGLASVGALVDSARSEGIEVRVEIEGEERALAPGVDLTAYRLLQEGLQAAAGSKASSAAVTVRYGERDLELEVTDDRPPGEDRASIAGTRERVALYGGHVRAVRREAGGFVLEARLPMHATARSSAGSPV